MYVSDPSQQPDSGWPAFPPPPQEPPVFPAVVQRSSAGSRRRAVIASVVVMAVAVLSVGAYFLAGHLYASSRIARAHAALSTAASHRSELDGKFTSISLLWNNTQQMTPAQAAKLVNDFIQTWKAQGIRVGVDDATLATADSKLQRERWLMTLNASRLDHESVRVAHARKAMAAAATIATDCMLDGMFLQALGAVSTDFAILDSAFKMNDPNTFRQALDKLTPDVTAALNLSTSPGLPPVVHELALDFRQLATDYVAYFNVSASGTANDIQAARVRVTADESALQALNTDQAGVAVIAFYQPLINTYRDEMDLAAA